MRSSFKILVGNPEGKRLHERLRRKSENNFNVALNDAGFGAVS
jgi:hypothetical protein